MMNLKSNKISVSLRRKPVLPKANASVIIDERLSAILKTLHHMRYTF